MSDDFQMDYPGYYGHRAMAFAWGVSQNDHTVGPTIIRDFANWYVKQDELDKLALPCAWRLYREQVQQ